MNYQNDKKSYGQNNYNGYNRNNPNSNSRSNSARVEKDYSNIIPCIEDGMNNDYCERIEKEVKDNFAKISVSQLRKFFSAVKLLEQKGMAKNLNELIMLKPKLAYAVGRDRNNNALQNFYVLVSKVIESTYDKLKQADNKDSESSESSVKASKETKRITQNFVDFFEAIIAYHKLYGKQQ